MTAQDSHSAPQKPHDEPLVTILVDNLPKSVRPGVWMVSDLKQAVGVDAALVLAEITPHGLNDLGDSDKTAVHEHQRFVSHVRTGGSS